MYQNSGEKIKGLAKVIAAVSVIVSVILGIFTWITIAWAGSGLLGLFTGLFYVGLGCVLAWILYVLLSGFGDLVSNSYQILLVVRKDAHASNNETPGIMERVRPMHIETKPYQGNETSAVRANTYIGPDGSIRCSNCDAKQQKDRVFCNKCGISFGKQ